MKILSFALFLSISVCLSAQSQPVDISIWREVGLRLSRFDDFDFIYKKQIEEGRYKRFRLLLSNFQFRRANNTNIFSASIGGAIGWENRRIIADKVQFIHGFEPFLILNTTATEDLSNLGVNTGLGYVLGFQLMATEHFYVALEAIPAIRVAFNSGDTVPDSFSASADFNSNAVSLTLVYRFQSTKP